MSDKNLASDEQLQNEIKRLKRHIAALYRLVVASNMEHFDDVQRLRAVENQRDALLAAGRAVVAWLGSGDPADRVRHIDLVAAPLLDTLKVVIAAVETPADNGEAEPDYYPFETINLFD